MSDKSRVMTWEPKASHLAPPVEDEYSMTDMKLPYCRVFAKQSKVMLGQGKWFLACMEACGRSHVSGKFPVRVKMTKEMHFSAAVARELEAEGYKIYSDDKDWVIDLQ
jgi:hypothetical protein